MVRRMTREAFWRWVEEQPGEARYERAGGEPVAMAPERAAHVRLKQRIWRALDRELRVRGGDCEAFGDGMTVEIGDDIDYEPDVLINCGPRIPDDSLVAPNPAVVVEVLSPTSRARDAGVKLADYFRLPTVRHYLIVRTERQSIIHHRRRDADLIDTRVVEQGRIDLDPLGIALDIAEIYGTGTCG